MLPTVEELFRNHSKARVLIASNKRFPVQTSHGTFGISRPMTDADVVETLINKYAK